MPHLAITEITNTCHYTQLLAWDLGNLIHVFTFAREALCQLGHLCSLYTIIFGFNISMFYTNEEIACFIVSHMCTIFNVHLCVLEVSSGVTFLYTDRMNYSDQHE